MTEELSREEVHTALDRAIEELLDAAGISSPPVDALALARSQPSLAGCLDKVRKQRGRRGAPAEPTEEQRQWTIAHEIGKHLLPELLHRLGIEPGGTSLTGASLAKLFAQRFLVPDLWFADDARACHYDLLELKERATVQPVAKSSPPACSTCPNRAC